jgi:carboxyl-terminal processing protease
MENEPNFQPQTEPTPATSSGAGFSRKHVVIALIVVLLTSFASFRTGLSMGNKGFKYEPKEFKIVNQKDQSQTVDYNLLWDAIKVVNDKYIEKPVDQQKVLYGAIRGAVSAAGDEYTTFFDPEELSDFRTELKGSFSGIGAEIGKRNNAITVIAPLEDSPAEKAGLLAKDIIVSVNGESTADWSVDQAVQKIRGERGTEVTLTIYREGKSTTFDVKIKRDKIEVKSVKREIKQVGDKKIGIITLSRFGDDTKLLLASFAQEMKREGVQGIVLDLRNDPGGYLETAVDVASYWVDKDKLIVREEHSAGEPILYNSYGYGTFAGLKTVVLINGGSASAAEIVAGALKDNGTAQLIGEKSFGKGSVQELVELPGGGAVKVTVAKWITPGGKNLNKDGLNPDIEVKLTEEDLTASKDPQLDKALEEVVK